VGLKGCGVREILRKYKKLRNQLFEEIRFLFDGNFGVNLSYGG
jgi:hypothetical protein